MRTRYLGILAFTLITGVIFASAFQFLGDWGAVGDQRTAVMVIATFALAAVILVFRFLTAGRDWDPPADLAFAAASLALLPILFPSWGGWLLIVAIPFGGLVTSFKLVQAVRVRATVGEKFYPVAIYAQFVLINAALVGFGLR